MTKNNKLLSIIVPVYNVKNTLDRCIQSLQNQTHKELEIILVDDGSTDGSGDICDAWMKVDKRITTIHQKNKGVSCARNVGLSVASGSFVFFCDPDDYLEKEFLDKMWKKMSENGVDLVACGYYVRSGSGKLLKNSGRKNIVRMNREDFLSSILDKNYFGGYVWNKVFSLDTIKKGGLLFDENISIYEDLKFVCEYALIAKTFLYIDDAMYVYSQTKEGAILSKNKQKYLTILEACDDLMRLYEKNVPRSIEKMKAFYIKSVCGVYFALKKECHLVDRYMSIAKNYYNDIKKNLSLRDRLQIFVDLYFPKLYGSLRMLYIKKLRWRNV